MNETKPKGRNVVKDEKSRKSHSNDTRNQKNRTTSIHPNASNPTSAVKNRVDPETVKYFSEITNLLENSSIDLEERSSICSNALEETRGKELELSTDFIISRTLQTLLENCDLDQLCGFLRGGSDSFAFIAVDKCGSHVAETAVKALSKHLNDEGSYLCVQDTLTLLCKVLVKDSINIMQSRAGSHVLRSLLCLCKGIPTEKITEFHSTKNVLAARLNPYPVPADEIVFENGFEKVFRDFVKGVVDNVRGEIVGISQDQFSSLVLQTALRLTAGDEKELIYLISSLLNENFEEEKEISSEKKREIMSLLDESASSHLLEVIIEVAPEKLYEKFLTEIFLGSLFDISSNQWGNFVMQALISSVKTKNQMDKIWEELGQKTKELLKIGKSGIVASLLVSCFRFQTNRRECCEALVGAVTLDNESEGNNNNNNIIEHILYLDGYLMETSSWKWPAGQKMHVLGCLMLQTIFKYPKQYVRNYSESLLSMENEHIYQTAKDSGGSRVLESFLSSDSSTKLKLKLIAKLKGYFGDLAMSGSSSFAVEKCFSTSNISLKEIICGELLEIRNDLSKTRHGFHLLKKFDIDLYARQPEQWKMSQKTKENAYGEFQALFGDTSDNKLKLNDQNNNNSNNDDDKLDYNNDYQTSSPKTKKPKLTKTPYKKDRNETNETNSHASKKEETNKTKYSKIPFEKNSKKFLRNSFNTQFVRQNVKKESQESELAQLAGKSQLSAGDFRKLFNASMDSDKNQKKPFVNKRKRF